MTDTLINILELLKKEPDVISENVWQDIDDYVHKTYIPVKKVGAERPCEASDFEECLPTVERNLNNLLLLFRALQGRKISKASVVNVLLLCGEHVNSNIWTTSKTVQCCEDLTRELCMLWHCQSVLQLLIGAEYEALFSAALVALRPKLLKDTWKTYPAAVSCYQWMLFHVKSPHLGAHLGSVIPTALIFLDDFVVENRIYGLKCLRHITDNVTRTELGWHGHGEVIYKTLEPIVYQREATVIEPLVSCLVAVLTKLEGGYRKEDTDYEWCRYDDTLARLLQVMEMEDRLALRLAYISSLPPLLEAAGLRLCRWSNRLLRVCSRYLEVAGFSERHEAPHALQAVKVFIQQCWPIVPHHVQPLLQMLLRLLYDVTDKPVSDEDEQIIHLIEDCLTQIIMIAPEESEILCKDIKAQTCFNSAFMSVVNKVFR